MEFHHLDPYALGGEASVDKVELRCRRHNDYEGRLYFGKRRRDGMGVARDAATSQGRPSVEFASSFRNELGFRNEFARGKADDGRPGRLPNQA